MYTKLIIFFLISIIFSFLCSMWEAVLLSLSPSYIQVKVNEGRTVGKTLQRFKENIDRPLAAILTLNTIAHTVGAIGVGQEATKIWINAHPSITGIIVPIIMTAAILIFSEIIPKTIGATNWKNLASFTAISLKIITFILSPIIFICLQITKSFNHKHTQNVFSRADLLALAQIGSKEGHLDKSEIELIENLLKFKNIKAKDIMTPRTVMLAASQNLSLKEFYDTQADLNFSRIPVKQQENSEFIVGYILKDEVLEHIVEDKGDTKLYDVMREILTIDTDHNIFQLLHEFIYRREHIALVKDKFGGTAGIVTMEDIVETLLGKEIIDETDIAVDMQDVAKMKWQKRYKNIKQLGNKDTNTRNDN